MAERLYPLGTEDNATLPSCWYAVLPSSPTGDCGLDCEEVYWCYDPRTDPIGPFILIVDMLICVWCCHVVLVVFFTQKLFTYFFVAFFMFGIQKKS